MQAFMRQYTVRVRMMGAIAAVLVVDDDALAGEMIAAVLEGMGHEAVLAEDGQSLLINASRARGLVFRRG